LKARDNPFSVSHILAVRYRFLEGGGENLFARLHGLDGRGAIVGPEGSGKTTLLEDLATELVRRGRSVHFVTLSAGQHGLSSSQRRAVLEAAKGQGFLLVDGADALAPRAWRALRRHGRRAGGFVVSAHAEGLLPTLWRTRTSPHLLEETVQALTGAGSEVFGRPVHELFHSHGGNLREALRELYDVCAVGLA
jgi:ATPase family associated with various cellular activities (AAA)